ncbi:MAG: hypothetical protein BRD43_05550 [Bacteroidetes bacterium QS_4_64_154]|nr:MAG: hypothetical protein BRD43_05550 [Bacteroidetes bacterium QS_4_64_154]
MTATCGGPFEATARSGSFPERDDADKSKRSRNEHQPQMEIGSASDLPESISLWLRPETFLRVSVAVNLALDLQGAARPWG